MITETIWCAGKPYELPVYDDPDIFGWEGHVDYEEPPPRKDDDEMDDKPIEFDEF